ncbi:hypothetical protein EJ357_09720 [Streptomyces cyaneochromogenes]|uniref:Nuclear transport factor 2 family protein n=1 Tax=Streptomyces cyaneochromogenes TaxID=2496836 RepID=A0A3Q9EM49_9ACTN|nr:hypothetical protein [Streptomyces cyaneochromogenes]AZQ33709.1 hypothetical protein EJ357_09720 [Streptomyces cyaneochromogenes]
MSWTRTFLAALGVCVLLLTGTSGCDSDAAREEGENGVSSSPVGKVLDDTDGEGRHLREVDEDDAPEVGIEVQPDPEGDGAWDVRLTLRDFRFSAAGAQTRAVAGRGLAHLYVDDRLVTRLRNPEYRLASGLVPRGTHQVTVRLYADDGTVWAVDGDPVESTAALTASAAETTAPPTADPSGPAVSAPGVRSRTGGRGSPDRAGKAS